jgi:SAM-dependent methyltransferase
MTTGLNYQENLDAYTDETFKASMDFVSKIGQHSGGFKDKVVLEFGAGYQFPHGNIILLLTLLYGAERGFGIDVSHPCNTCNDNQRRMFWKKIYDNLRQTLDIAGYKNDDRLRFVSQETLWLDTQFSKLTLLQMSVSDMYFRDDIFDLAISNAVFEHVKEPEKTFRELYRVCKPGGLIIASWNPFTSLDMGGHDIGIPYYYPWAHLRLSEDEHIRMLRQVFSNEELYTTVFPQPHIPTHDAARAYARDPIGLREGLLGDLNRLRIKDFLRIAEENGFEIATVDYVIPDKNREYLTEDIRKELSEYSEEELLVSSLFIVLRKKIIQSDRNVESRGAVNKCSQISQLEAVIREKEVALNQIYNSHGWKALVKYYRIRDKFLPEDSVLRQAAKYLWRSFTSTRG